MKHIGIYFYNGNAPKQNKPSFILMNKNWARATKHDVAFHFKSHLCMLNTLLNNPSSVKSQLCNYRFMSLLFVNVCI